MAILCANYSGHQSSTAHRGSGRAGANRSASAGSRERQEHNKNNNPTSTTSMSSSSHQQQDSGSSGGTRPREGGGSATSQSDGPGTPHHFKLSCSLSNQYHLFICQGQHEYLECRSWAINNYLLQS